MTDFHEEPCPYGESCPDARKYGAIHPKPTHRSEKDFAIEFGEHLAQRAERLLAALNADPRPHIGDEWRALESAIYEFRKRAAKVRIERLEGKAK